MDEPLAVAWGRALAMGPQEAQARLAVLVELCPVGIFFDDPHDRCIFANQAFCQLMEMTVDEALGDGWTSRVHPEDLPGLLQARAASVAAREPVFRAEYRFVTPRGRQGWVEEQTRPVFQSDGALLGYVGTTVDITRHKDEELLLQRVNAALCARLSHDQAELTAQREKVADLHAALRVLLSLREQERWSEGGQVIASIQRRILPLLESLRRVNLPSQAQQILTEIQVALREVGTPPTSRWVPLGLSPAQERVAEGICAGLSTKEIAQRLGVAQSTVETHRAALRRKLGLSRNQSLRLALAEAIVGSGVAQNYQ